MEQVRKTAVELLFDPGLEASLDRLLHAIADAGLPSPLLGWGVRPHVSLLLGSDAGEGWDRVVATRQRGIRDLRAS